MSGILTSASKVVSPFSFTHTIRRGSPYTQPCILSVSLCAVSKLLKSNAFRAYCAQMKVPRILKQFQIKILTLQLRFLIAKDLMSKDGVITHKVLCHNILCRRVQIFSWKCFKILGSLIQVDSKRLPPPGGPWIVPLLYNVNSVPSEEVAG